MNTLPTPISQGYHNLLVDLKSQYTEMKTNEVISNIHDLGHKIAHFIEENWQKLTAYLVAWALIIVIMGGMHGFEKVGNPLAIGLSAGVGFGILTGIVIVGSHRKSDTWTPQSGWQLFRNHILRKLDQGTNALFISVIVTLMLQVMSYLPYGIGVLVGLAMGNHLITQILMKDKAKPDLSPQQQFEKIEARLSALEQGGLDAAI